MLTQPIESEPATDDKPQSYVILATERLKEYHASIFALGPNGGIRKAPPYLTLPDRESALAELRMLGADGKLNHASYMYTVFRFA